MVWGGDRDPLDVLAEWVDQQIEGIGRSSMGPTSVGALMAFDRMKVKIAEARAGLGSSRGGRDG